MEKCQYCGYSTSNKKNYYYSVFGTSEMKTLCDKCLKEAEENDKRRKKSNDDYNNHWNL